MCVILGRFCPICQPNSPTMVMDYWTGWYDVWGELHHVLPQEGKEGPPGYWWLYGQKYTVLFVLTFLFFIGRNQFKCAPW